MMRIDEGMGRHRYTEAKALGLSLHTCRNRRATTYEVGLNLPAYHDTARRGLGCLAIRS